MLEGVVEQDDIEFGILFCQHVNTMTAFPVDSNGDTREFLLHLIGFVAYFGHSGLFVGLDKSPALALVAPAEHSDMELVLQQTYQILYMWRLARAANSDIAYADDRYLEGTRLQHPISNRMFRVFTANP